MKSHSEPFNSTCLHTCAHKHTYLQHTFLTFNKVLKWIKDLQKQFAAEGREVNNKTIEEFAWQTLNSGKVGSVSTTASLPYPTTLSFMQYDLHAFFSGDPWIWPCCVAQDRSTVCRSPCIAHDHHTYLVID